MSISTSIPTNYKINDTDLGDILVSKTYIMSTYRSFIENTTIPDTFWWGAHWPISAVIPRSAYYARRLNRFPISYSGFFDEVADISISQGTNINNGYYRRNMIFLMKDGTIWGCGRNSYQSLVPGFYTKQASANNGLPHQMGTDNDWIHVSSGEEHTVAIKRDGSLWGWGDNGFGQMGTYGTSNTTPPYSSGSWGYPANIGDELQYYDTYNNYYTHYITQWKYVSCGYQFTLFIDYAGQLWSAGRNAYGKLGIGLSSLSNRSYLTLVDHGPWKFVHAGEDSWIGIKENGRLYGCGKLFNIGNSFYNASTPIEIGPISGETWIHCHLNFDNWVAIRSDGTLWTGGIYRTTYFYKAVFGQPEDFTPSYQSGLEDIVTAIKVPGGPYRYAACGLYSIMAIGANGKLYCWGNNQDYQIQPDLQDSYSTNSNWNFEPKESRYSSPYTNWKLIKGTDFGYIGLRSTQYI